MSEYTKLKNAELEALLKQRGLPHSGKKAELIARLQEDDKSKDGPSAAAPTASKEDEIDWDDEAPADASNTASAQNGSVQQAKPADTAVAQTSTPEPAAEVPKPAESTETAANTTDEPPKEAKDFTIGLAEISIDDEIEKRKARAAKFGITENDPLAEEALKSLERQKKFGESAGPRGLNEALSDRRPKRRHDGVDDSGRVNKQRGRGGRNFGRRGGGGGGGPRRPREGNQERSSNGSGLSAADRAAADARKARFA